MIIELPWFNPVLNPNEKSWKKKMFARKKQREEAYLIASACQDKPSGEDLAMSVMFYPPTRHRRDLDNCLGSIKGAVDGIADAIGIDDTNFRPITIDFGEITKNGLIIIEINSN